LSSVPKSVIEGCKAGKRDAQRVLYESISARLYAICLRYAAHEDDAQDLLHDAMIVLFTKIHQYDERGDFMGWAIRITVNTALQWLRKNKKLVFTDEVDEKKLRMVHDAVEVINEKALLQLIARLPSGYRTVFNLFAIEGYSHAEIASIMGITESTSRSQFARARALLQKQIRQEVPLPAPSKLA
jgi:RNA polymerase sigma-70 factor (ECF subfamily)